jgi:hypothetical protein
MHKFRLRRTRRDGGAPRKRMSYANVAATLALFLAVGGGTAWATTNYIITSTKQIKPSVLKKLHGANGKNGKNGQNGTNGTNGTNGATGAAGAAGASGSAGTPALYKRTDLHYGLAATDSSPSGSYKQLEVIGTFTKLNASSAITLVWTSHATGGNGTTSFCHYQLRIDGLDDQGSASTSYSGTAESGAVVYDANAAFSVTDVFTALAVGSHTVSVWDRALNGPTSCTDNNGSFGHDVYVLETP